MVSGALLGLLIVAGILVALVTGGNGPELLMHHDARIDVSAGVPQRWHTQNFDNEVGLATHTGFVVSNVKRTFTYPDLRGGMATTSWNMMDLPPHAVVVEISESVRLPVVCDAEGNLPVTDFPLSLEAADVITTGRSWGAPPRHYISACLDNGKHFGVHAWFFPNASHSDRELAAALINSIEPTS